MADRTYVHLHVPKWATEIQEVRELLDEEGYDEVVERGRVVIFGIPEVADDLECEGRLQALQVPYDKQYDGTSFIRPGWQWIRYDENGEAQIYAANDEQAAGRYRDLRMVYQECGRDAALETLERHIASDPYPAKSLVDIPPSEVQSRMMEASEFDSKLQAFEDEHAGPGDTPNL